MSLHRIQNSKLQLIFAAAGVCGCRLRFKKPMHLYTRLWRTTAFIVVLQHPITVLPLLYLTAPMLYFPPLFILYLNSDIGNLIFMHCFCQFLEDVFSHLFVLGFQYIELNSFLSSFFLLKFNSAQSECVLMPCPLFKAKVLLCEAAYQGACHSWVFILHLIV